MSIHGVDKRFALIAENGDVLFAYKKEQRATGRYGFALSTTDDRDKYGGGVYVESIEEVITRLVFDGWKARVTTIDLPGRQRHGSMGIGKRAIAGYWVHDSLLPLVEGAPIAPNTKLKL